MIDQPAPMVSVGLPVFNEKERIKSALESWLAQDYPDFEIVLADNASTDGTREICREYAARDQRIRLIENQQNIGPIRNHHLTFDISRGKFFVWAGGHDHVHPSFISKTLDVLLNNPSVVMCSVRSEFRDESDVAWRTTRGGFDSIGQPPYERFAGLINHLTSGATANFIYGLYRRDILSHLISNLKKIIGADVVMLANLALLGDVMQLNDILYYRYVPQNPDGTKRLKRHIHQLIGGEQFQVNTLMPYVGMLFAYMQIIEESKLPAVQRQLMYKVVLQEAERLKLILADELENFLRVANKELDMLNGIPEIQRYRATQILDGVCKLQVLGFETDETRSVASRSSEILREAQRQIQKKTGRKVLAWVSDLHGLPGKISRKINRLKQTKSGDK